MSRQFKEMTEAGPVDTNGKLIETCIKRIHRDYSAFDCGRKLKGDPEFPHLCGTHIGVIRREHAKSDERSQLANGVTAAMSEAQARADKAARVLGAELRVETAHSTTGPSAWLSRPTGRVSLDIAELEALANRVAALEETVQRYSESFP